MPTPLTEPVFFATPEDLREWLLAHHETAPELWVGFFKKATGKPSVTWPQVVDEALCFGWIDGIRKSIDAERYMNRLTPRRPRSNWSLVNLNRVAELTAAGRMMPAGLRAYEQRDLGRSGAESLARQAAELDPEALATFQADPAAWDFFQARPPSYRKSMCWFVASAKKPETRRKRLQLLIAESRAGRTISLMKPRTGEST